MENYVIERKKTLLENIKQVNNRIKAINTLMDPPPPHPTKLSVIRIKIDTNVNMDEEYLSEESKEEILGLALNLAMKNQVALKEQFEQQYRETIKVDIG